ncbi:uncharacterized protein LOC110456239 [Mizuhopecten yessoensis]|uniref:Uncharacterized protein n=1 Tax=Mizuhopecten yessoensis TaxID=6573 RepID=A0A210QBF6_MIZYE|nr:uncharacterized protein LOC110456239 [Mizuhopecten yessoensis]OWF46066.1 hypothetical protein KP79_PYT03762 [Mizuhopecten yessoensis]
MFYDLDRRNSREHLSLNFIMVPMAWLTSVLTFGGVVVMAAARPNTIGGVTAISPFNSSTSSLLTSISTTMQNDSKHQQINCSNTKSVEEIFSCILQGMLSEPVLIGAGIIILLTALFVIFSMVQSKPCRNGWKTVDLNMDEEKKMMA